LTDVKAVEAGAGVYPTAAGIRCPWHNRRHQSRLRQSL